VKEARVDHTTDDEQVRGEREKRHTDEGRPLPNNSNQEGIREAQRNRGKNSEESPGPEETRAEEHRTDVAEQGRDGEVMRVGDVQSPNSDCAWIDAAMMEPARDNERLLVTFEASRKLRNAVELNANACSQDAGQYGQRDSGRKERPRRVAVSGISPADGRRDAVHIGFVSRSSPGNSGLPLLHGSAKQRNIFYFHPAQL